MSQRVSGRWAVGVMVFVLLLCGLARGESPYPIAWIQQLGTSSGDASYSVAVAASGNAFISGLTRGDLGGTNAGESDAFLAKYDPAGKLLWTRQLGTSSSDYGYAVAVDASGNAFISGGTWGSLAGPSAGGRDAFLAKYDSSGNLLWTEQLGTWDDDYSQSVAVDGEGNAFISGWTTGDLGGPYTGSDAFLAKYDSSGNLLWKRQLGTPRTDYSFSVAVDASGNAFISGWTLGDLGATNGGETDTFLTKYDSDGNLQWTQQLARRDLDGSCSVAVDGAGNVFISGWTYGDLGGPSAGDSDAFLIKYDPAGTLLWTQQLGTAEYDRSDSVAVDAAGNVFISMCAQNILHTEHDVRYRNAFLVKYATPEPLVLEVEIDVKPGARSNNIDLNSNGVVSVAILGSENLDASEIDQETLEFAAASPKAKGKHGKTPSFRDVNGDSYEDLVVRFPAQDLDLDADAEEATLTGQLLDGTKFTGTDSVRIVGKSD